jgi:hypothetical protein
MNFEKYFKVFFKSKLHAARYALRGAVVSGTHLTHDYIAKTISLSIFRGGN